MKAIFCIILELSLFFLSSCHVQSLKGVNNESKAYTKEGMDLLETVYVLRSHKDTLKYQQAIACFDSAIYSDSTNYFAYWKKSELLCELKQYNNARLTISIYSKTHKDNLDFLLREAYLYEKGGELKLAKNNYTIILDKINHNLEKGANKKLMIKKLFLLTLLENSSAKGYLNVIKSQYPNDEEVNNANEFLSNFSRTEFINYQLTGTNEDITVSSPR